MRSPLALWCTDGPCYALVVLLVGSCKDTPFCSFGVDEGMGEQEDPRQTSPDDESLSLRQLSGPGPHLGEVRIASWIID